MIHATLKQATRGLHTALESKLQVLMSDNISLDQYKAIQQKFYGFYRPIELRLSAIGGWDDPEFQLKQRLKVPLLEKDLAALAIDDRQRAGLPRCEDLPQIESVPQALGCLYVLEGSTLGGRVITPHLKRVLPVSELSGCSFFHSYGLDVGRMWASFLGILDRYCQRNGGDPLVVRAAIQTFETLDRWFCHAN